MIILGNKVTDRLTGVTGIAFGRCSYLYGCEQIGIQARAREDGTAPSLLWVDIQRVTTEPVAETGGPSDNAPISTQHPS